MAARSCANCANCADPDNLTCANPPADYQRYSDHWHHLDAAGKAHDSYDEWMAQDCPHYERGDTNGRV